MNESTFSFLRDALGEAYYLVEQAVPEDFSGENREIIQQEISEAVNTLENRLITNWYGTPSLFVSSPFPGEV